jgi:hypothetical protein
MDAPVITIETITEQCQAYAGKHAELAAIVERIETLRRRVVEQHTPQLKAAIQALADQREQLTTSIARRPDLFDKPRTRMLHGVKVGFRKQTGRLLIPNVEFTVKRLKELYIDQLGVLIKTTEKPIKTALAELPANDLKKLGVTVTNDTDEVVVKVTDSDIDKVIAALLGQDSDDEEEG